MKIDVVRDLGTSGYTIGTMFVNGKYECYTLEDEVRDGPKIYGETAIPAGTYKVIISYSNRFKRDLPLLVGVEGFEGIRIHPGNYASNTLGCILVGVTKMHASIGSSQVAFKALYPQILDAWARHEEIWLTVR